MCHASGLVNEPTSRVVRIPPRCCHSPNCFGLQKPPVDTHTVNMHCEFDKISGSAYPAAVGILSRHIHAIGVSPRSEEHTSELQSRLHLVCRLLLEKKKRQHREMEQI